MKLTYAEQLKHPNWQKKRLKVLDASGFECQDCGAKDETLHVHHKRYVKGRMAWEYGRQELACLCESCHEKSHEIKETLSEVMLYEFKECPTEEFALGLLSGFLGSMHIITPELMAKGAKLSEPAWSLGIMLAAMGPEDLARGIRQKIKDGVIPEDHPLIEAAFNSFKGI